MLTLVFTREAMILSSRFMFRLESGIPPEVVWPALRKEGWTLETEVNRDLDGNRQEMFVSIRNPDGIMLNGPNGIFCTDRKVRKEYRRTVDRMIRAYYGGTGLTP